MFTIGAFARLAGVSTRTLRYYDEVGLLAPAATDPATGYRSYRASQLARLHRILVLKDLGLSLEQMGPLLDDGLSAARLSGMLAATRAELGRRIAEDQARLVRVEQRLRYIELEDDVSVDMVIKQVPELRVAQVRWQGEEGLDFSGLGQFIPQARRQLADALAAAGVGREGPVFLHYEERPDGSLTPAVAAIIGSQPFAGTGDVEVAVLSATDVVVTVYRGAGDHDLIGPIYGQMARYAEDQGYQPRGPGRDHMVGRDGDDYVVELQLPVAGGATDPAATAG